MKILHIVEAFASGVLSFLQDITQWQVQDNEVYIAWGARPLTPSNVAELFPPEVHFIQVKSFHGALWSVLNPGAYCSVRKIYQEVSPDLVHLHSSAAGFVGRAVLLGSKTPVLYTPHGYAFLPGNGNVVKRGGYHVAEWLMARLSKATTVACSKGEYDEAQRLSQRCTYVSNGINVDKLAPYVKDDAGAATDGPLKICTSGRILKQKNPAMFNEIASALPEYEFIWIGGGELQGELTAPNIKVTGWVSREESLDLLLSADVFLLPSLWEGLPIALLEAMYVKKVCVVSDVIGNRDVIRHGENGFVCDVSSKDGFVAAIRQIAEKRSEARQLAEAAHADVVAHYNTAGMAKAYDKIYKDVVGSAQG